MAIGWAVKRHRNGGKSSYEVTGNVASEGVADGVGKVASEVVGVEVAYVHHGGIVFAAEPPLASSGVVTSEIAGVAAWRV